MLSAREPLPYGLGDREHYIYYVQSGIGGPVKVGQSRNIRLRFASMLTDNGHPLTLLALEPVSFCTADNVENERHDMLARVHIRGEWFSPGKELEELLSLESIIRIDLPVTAIVGTGNTRRRKPGAGGRRYPKERSVTL